MDGLFLLTIPRRSQPNCWLSWKTEASCAENVIGHCTDTLRSAGSSNFFRGTPILPLIERKILRAK